MKEKDPTILSGFYPLKPFFQKTHKIFPNISAP
jgi:hypothetical protein